jgi:hypothetical protein
MKATAPLKQTWSEGGATGLVCCSSRGGTLAEGRLNPGWLDHLLIIHLLGIPALV